MLVKDEMRESPFFKTIRNILGKRGRTNREEPRSSAGGEPAIAENCLLERQSLPAIYVDALTFSDGTRLALKKDSIVVLTGPNNSGKSSVLRSIDDALSHDGSPEPAVDRLNFAVRGSVADFQKFIQERTFKTADGESVWVDIYKTYDLASVKNDISGAFKGKSVSALFFSRLNAEARLSAIKPARRHDWTRGSPTEPLQWLDVEVETEAEIAELFEKAFGFSLWVNRTAGENVILHVCDHDPPDFPNFRSYRDWLSRLPTLESQGDGMKSFAAALLAIRVHPKSLILLDEPEAFLHDPQAVKLAEVITTETSPDTQIWVATHSDEVVRGLLDSSSDRIAVVRLDRIGNVTRAKVLESEQVKVLWADPLLRTSDILSALFHEVAVICEGESDVRFFRALSDANKPSERLPDFRFYHVGGKDKIANIVASLRPLNLPVCVLCDLDLLSDYDKFLRLYSVLGGKDATVLQDVKKICQHVSQRNALITGQEAARRLMGIVDEIRNVPKLSNSQRASIAAVHRETSPWSRLKVDGYRAFENPTIVSAFERVYESCKSTGLLMNREGELEGLCRDAPRTPNLTWIEDVLTRDLRTDPSLSDARQMLAELRNCIATVRQSFTDTARGD